MTGEGKALQALGFGVMALIGLMGSLLIVTETFTDPGGWTAVWFSVAWVAPMVAFSLLSLTRPTTAGPLLAVATVVACALTVAQAEFDITPRVSWGPDAAVAIVALGVSLAFLGLRRPLLAGTLMLATGAVQLAANTLGHLGHVPGESPGLRAMLNGSSAAMTVPVLVTGTAYLLAGLVGRERPQAVESSEEDLPASSRATGTRNGEQDT